MKEISIYYDEHALFRLVERGSRFGLTLEESQKRVKETLFYGSESKKHLSKNHFSSCRYFPDNTTMFVIWKNGILHKKTMVRIKTIIIEAGRP